MVEEQAEQRAHDRAHDGEDGQERRQARRPVAVLLHGVGQQADDDQQVQPGVGEHAELMVAGLVGHGLGQSIGHASGDPAADAQRESAAQR